MMPDNLNQLEIRPISNKDAGLFVDENHRHNQAPWGNWFSIALYDWDELVGVAMVGRPISRILDDGLTAEVRRLTIKGTVPNGCSMLYGRAKRICILMGFRKVITYTLQSESGSSLKAVGAKAVARVRARSWDTGKRHRETQPVQLEPKIRWEL